MNKDMTPQEISDDMAKRTVLFESVKKWLSAARYHGCFDIVKDQSNPRTRVIGFECEKCGQILGVKIENARETMHEIIEEARPFLSTRSGRQRIAGEINKLNRKARGTIVIEEEYES